MGYFFRNFKFKYNKTEVVISIIKLVYWVEPINIHVISAFISETLILIKDSRQPAACLIVYQVKRFK